jgi:hypothetical protein
MTTLCKRIIVSADKYNVALNITNHTSSDNNDPLTDVNFSRILGCINQLKVLSVAVVETFDNLTCLVNDINERALGNFTIINTTIAYYTYIYNSC